MKKAYSNNTKNTVYVGGLGISPGETRMVEAQFVPDANVEDIEEPEADPVRELLALSVKELDAAVSNSDAPLEQDLLEGALEAEKAKSTPRVGAVKALGDAINAAIETTLEKASSDADPDADPDPDPDQ